MENSTPQNAKSTNKKRAQLASLLILTTLAILSTIAVIVMPLMNKKSSDTSAESSLNESAESTQTENTNQSTSKQSQGTEFAFNHESDIDLGSNKPNISSSTRSRPTLDVLKALPLIFLDTNHVSP